jgi:hypothetical protein
MRVKFRYLKRLTRRSIEKRLGGYLPEATLNLTYPFREKKDPQKKFFIFTHQRSGSTLLVNLLDSHSMVDCQGELLLDPMLSPMGYLSRREKLLSAEVFGFKLQPHHFTYQKIANPANFINTLVNSGYKIIKLKRRNIVRAALSLQYALKSGTFHRTRMSSGHQDARVYINPEDVIESIKWIEYNSEELDRLSQDYPLLELTYEDDLLDNSVHQITVNSISDYLEIPHTEVHTDLRKVIPSDLSETFVNAEQIISVIRSTNYASYLEQDQ